MWIAITIIAIVIVAILAYYLFSGKTTEQGDEEAAPVREPSDRKKPGPARAPAVAKEKTTDTTKQRDKVSRDESEKSTKKEKRDDKKASSKKDVAEGTAPAAAAPKETAEETPTSEAIGETSEATEAAPPDAALEKEGDEHASEPPTEGAAGDVDRRERRKAFRKGLKHTRGGFIAKLGKLLRGKKELDADLLDQIEEVLLTSDVGMKFTERLTEALGENLSGKELSDADAVWAFIREQAEEVLSPSAPPLDIEKARPFVIMVVGVNGVGKTTTIAKLAARYAQQGKKVVLAAGDTFRAAAVRQLEMWGERVGAPVIKDDKQGADPASVVFKAIEYALKVDADVVIADTAGRLHTKTPLMDELKKVKRVMAKALEGAPHEVLLVLDANTGQNANLQTQKFKDDLDVTGIVLTKLDGTAKGGVILGICDEHRVPIRFVGVGERDHDLREFDAEDFVAVLFEQPEEGKESAA